MAAGGELNPHVHITVAAPVKVWQGQGTGGRGGQGGLGCQDSTAGRGQQARGGR